MSNSAAYDAWTKKHPRRKKKPTGPPPPTGPQTRAAPGGTDERNAMHPDTTIREIARALGNKSPTGAQIAKAREILAELERAARGIQTRTDGYVLQDASPPVPHATVEVDGLGRCTACGVDELLRWLRVDGVDVCASCAKDLEIEVPDDDQADELEEPHDDDREVYAAADTDSNQDDEGDDDVEDTDHDPR